MYCFFEKYCKYGVPKPLRGTGKVSMGLCLCNYILIDSYMQLLNKTCIFTTAVLQSYYAHAIHFCLKYTPPSHEYITFWTNKLINKHAKCSLFSFVHNILGPTPQIRSQDNNDTGFYKWQEN